MVFWLLEISVVFNTIKYLTGFENGLVGNLKLSLKGIASQKIKINNMHASVYCCHNCWPFEHFGNLVYFQVVRQQVYNMYCLCGFIQPCLVYKTYKKALPSQYSHILVSLDSFAYTHILTSRHFYGINLSYNTILTVSFH